MTDHRRRASLISERGSGIDNRADAWSGYVHGTDEGPVMIGRLLEAHETVLTAVRKAIKVDETEDWGTNELLMSDVLRRHELAGVVPFGAPGRRAAG